MQEINKQRRSAQSRQSGKDLIRQSKKGVVIGRSPFIKAPPKIIVRHTRFPRPRDVGNRIKAVQIRVVLERKPVIQNPFQDIISKIYVPQNCKTKSVFARGTRKELSKKRFHPTKCPLAQNIRRSDSQTVIHFFLSIIDPVPKTGHHSLPVLNNLICQIVI